MDLQATPSEKAKLICSKLWYSTIDYSEATNSPLTLGFQIYIWNALYYGILDIIKANNLECEMRKGFIETTCQCFDIKLNEDSILNSILHNRQFALDQFSRRAPFPISQTSLLKVHHTALMLYSLDKGHEDPPMPTDQQQTEFLLAVLSVTKFATELLPQVSPHSTSVNNPKEIIYSVTTFDGHTLRIPQSEMNSFRVHDLQNQEEYFSKYNSLRKPLSEALVQMSQDYLRQYVPRYNSDSFMFLSSAILCSSYALAKHYPTFNLIMQDIALYSTQLLQDMFCKYPTVDTLSKAQNDWKNELRCKFHLNFQNSFYTNILENEKILKSFAKEIYVKACPRSTYNRKSEKALINTLHYYDGIASSLVKKIDSQ